jgi:hypothetical protein
MPRTYSTQPTKSSPAWSAEELGTLRERLRCGMSLVDIATSLGRPRDDVQRAVLGLYRPGQKLRDDSLRAARERIRAIDAVASGRPDARDGNKRD